MSHLVDLTTLSASQGFIIQGDAAGDKAGGSVSTVGDINGDGFEDLIVGAYGGDDGGNNAGETYVAIGSAEGFGKNVVTDGFARKVIDLTELTAIQGFVIQGAFAGDSAGQSAASRLPSRSVAFIIATEAAVCQFSNSDK